MRLIAVPVLLVVLLAGCADRAGPIVDAVPAQAADPVALIGNWLVIGADEEEGTVLRLAGPSQVSDLSLWRSCGQLGGGWRADGAGMFLADVPSPTLCARNTVPSPSWLDRVTAYRLDGADRELLDAGGAVVARLVPATEPIPVNPKLYLPDAAKPPVVTDEDRQGLRPGAPLPAGLTPATAETLVGRWVADAGVHQQVEPHVELNADSTWSGSDGCNPSRGRWIAGSGGTLLATIRPSTNIGCDNHPAGGWLFDARLAAIDGDQLVFFDAAAEELGRLHRG
ncbi:hypothetical protein GCM10022251_68320 [Phytohabitans flavus]|uniref:DUF306 domain-containing protein n=1 Tax=Phytohabitans flavus TaxID=1076124 RepID=A0A6F8XQR5_9ACTN|nr:hypothetical protein [Phytohabitans flavus]BCB76160.1 hypothetical protein Pflav_025700 [Phytohabitans flavus]